MAKVLAESSPKQTNISDLVWQMIQNQSFFSGDVEKSSN